MEIGSLTSFDTVDVGRARHWHADDTSLVKTSGETVFKHASAYDFVASESRFCFRALSLGTTTVVVWRDVTLDVTVVREVKVEVPLMLFV